MRFKRSVALVVAASASVVMIGTGVPSAGADATPAAPTPAPTGTALPATCTAPPVSPNATPGNRDKFITAWAPRVANQAWITQFANAATLPDDIAAEGFHAMDADTQAWLVSCLVDNVLAAAGQTATVAQRSKYQLGLDILIFGKQQLGTLKKQVNETQPAQSAPAPDPNLTIGGLNARQEALQNVPSITSASLPKSDSTAPTTSSVPTATVPKSAVTITPKTAQPDTTTAAPKATQQTLNPTALLNALGPVLSVPLVALILKAVNEVLQLVAKIQKVLFTLPGLNLLAFAFYRVCAESATQPLACSVMLPVGVPIPADVTGDNFPDVLADLLPDLGSNLGDFGVQFHVARLSTSTGPLPAHVFAVYDTPIVKKRIEFGYDGRASTLANSQVTYFTLHNLAKALTGDIDVTAQVTSSKPGTTEALTFAIKDLVGGSIGVQPSEENPVAGAVQMSPFPEKFKVDAHLTHTASQDEDVFAVSSTTPTTVNALVTQDTTTTSPKSHREFTALVDTLPTSLLVDLVHQGENQKITYSASAPIAHVRATDTATPNTSAPGSYTRSVYDVLGVPTEIAVTLQGTHDVRYQANAQVQQVSFSTQTYDGQGLAQLITAQAQQIPKQVHVTNVAGADRTDVTYDADGVLPSVALQMYNRAEDKSDLKATATGIPTHLQFSQTKSTGVLDFQANTGIGKINATYSRNEGAFLSLPGDHATVLKAGQKLGVDFQLSGFRSAHFDGSQKTIVSLGLDPGGQAFDAIADLDDPNVYATVHVGSLPSSMGVVIDPVGGSATYSASSVIPDLTGSFTKRDTQTLASLSLLQLPKNIAVTFNTSGAAPSLTYSADSRLGKIDATYQKAPNDLAFHGVISDLPLYLAIQGQAPIVFDARTASTAPTGSDFLGQVLFQYTTDGTFQSPPTADDHLYLNTVGGQTHAEVLYSGLKYLSADTTNQELHAEIRNVSPRIVRAYLTTDDLSATGTIDKVPAQVRIDQVGNDIQYHATSAIDAITTDVVRANGDHVSAAITGVPTAIDLLFDMTGSKLNWNASGPTGSIGAQAHLTPDTLGGPRTFDAALTISDIPAQWYATFGSGNVSFVAGGAGIGAIDARVTNHGAYHVLPGDHLSAYYDDPTGDLDASLHISNLTQARFSKLTDAGGGGFVADLDMGNHGLFNLGAHVNLGADLLDASGNFDHLPAHIHLRSDGGRIQYNGDDNPSLTLDIAAGDSAAIASVPAPTNVHGISVRDGASVSGGKAVKAHVFLTGLPDTLDLNSPAGTYTVGNYHPSIDALVVDVKLTKLVSTPLSLLLTQHVGTDPVTFTFGPFVSSTAGDGTSSLSVNYTASRDMGSLDAEATYGTTDDAHLFISEIPGGTAPSITVSAAFGKDQKTVHVGMSHGIGEILAQYKHVGDIDFGASVDLKQVPKTVDLVIGKATATDGSKTVTAPDFTFTASDAGLDIDAFANASLFTPVNVTAAVSLHVVDLGTVVTGSLDGTKLHITSTPKTKEFTLNAAGSVGVDVDLGFGDPNDTGFYNTGHLTVNAQIHRITLGFKDMADLGLELGITSALTGDFSHFSFGEDTDTTIYVDDHFGLAIDLPVFGVVHIGLFNYTDTLTLGNIVKKFHISSNQFGEIFSIPAFEALLAHCDVTVNARPRGEFNQSAESVELDTPLSDGEHTPAWLITPSPLISLPDFLLDVVAFFASPLGNGIKFGFDCDLGP